MDSSFWFDAIILGWSIVYTEGSRIIISTLKMYFFAAFHPGLHYLPIFLFFFFFFFFFFFVVVLRPRTVSSTNHTFSWASLNKQLTSTSCTYFRLLLTTTLLESFSGREENDRRNYFMINLHESMGPGRDRTRDPWICSQTRICCQTLFANECI